MKMLLLVASLQLSTVLYAEDIVVFAKGDSLMLGTNAAAATVKDPVKVSFLAAFKADCVQPAAFAGPDQLAALPNGGRKVPGANGGIQYHRSFHGGLVLDVTLNGLAPNHTYALTLNGNPARAGNDNLVDHVSGNEKERYVDFYTMTTDADGGYHGTFGILLPASPYDVRFYVKDTTDFRIVLYDDFFQFTVE
jgi:hypothetical protein